MRTVIVGFALTNRPEYRPIYAEVPIADKVLLDAIEKPETAANFWAACRVLMGIPAEAVCVQGILHNNFESRKAFDAWMREQHYATRVAMGYIKPQVQQTLAILI